MKRLFLALLILCSLALVAFAPLAQPEDPASLESVLIWLATGPGALIVVGAALAFLLEKIPGWGTVVPEKLRPWIVLALSVGLAFGAQYLLTRPDVVAVLQPIYATLFMVAAAWLGTQLGYGQVKVFEMRGPRA